MSQLLGHDGFISLANFHWNSRALLDIPIILVVVVLINVTGRSSRLGFLALLALLLGEPCTFCQSAVCEAIRCFKVADGAYWRLSRSVTLSPSSASSSSPTARVAALAAALVFFPFFPFLPCFPLAGFCGQWSVFFKYVSQSTRSDRLQLTRAVISTCGGKKQG